MINDNKNSGFFSKDHDLRNRIFFTVFILSVYRLGTYIPLPGIDPESLKTMMDSSQEDYLECSIYFRVELSVVWLYLL